MDVKHSHRSFLETAGAAGAVAAIEAPSLTLPTLPGTQRSHWQPDGVGSLARMGVLTPDFDPVPESEMWAMAPHGVSVHASRVTWEWNHDPRGYGIVTSRGVDLQPLEFRHHHAEIPIPS